MAESIQEQLIDYKQLGMRAHHLRVNLSLNQAEVAEKVGICASFYGHIERGTRIPSCETLYRMAQVFHCSTDYLLGLKTSTLSEGIPATATGDERRIFMAAIEAVAQALSLDGKV